MTKLSERIRTKIDRLDERSDKLKVQLAHITDETLAMQQHLDEVLAAEAKFDGLAGKAKTPHGLTEDDEARATGARL